MAEFIELAANEKQKPEKNTETEKARTERERLLDGYLKTPYEKMLEKLKLVESKPTDLGFPEIQLAKVVRMPGDIGPVGPVGRIEDIIS